MLGLGLAQGSDAYLIGSIVASLFAATTLIVGARRSAARVAGGDDLADRLPGPRARARETGAYIDGALRDDDDADLLAGIRDEDPFNEDAAEGRRAYAGQRSYADEPGYGAPQGYAEDQGYRAAQVYAEDEGYGQESGGRIFRAQRDEEYAPPRAAEYPDQRDEEYPSLRRHDDAATAGAPEQAAVGDPAAPHVVASAAIPVQAGVVEDVRYDDDDEDPPDEPAPQPVSVADGARVATMTADVFVIDGRPRYHLTGCGHLAGRESEALPVGEAVELGFSPCGLCEPNSALLAAARRV
jgi:hypothetical protein